MSFKKKMIGPLVKNYSQNFVQSSNKYNILISNEPKILLVFNDIFQKFELLIDELRKKEGHPPFSFVLATPVSNFLLSSAYLLKRICTICHTIQTVAIHMYYSSGTKSISEVVVR